MGGFSEEREISLKTGRAVFDALLSLGYDAVAIDAGKDLPERLVSERVDVAFIALHGRFGEDGCVQGLLEVMGIPYTGSGVLSSSLCMDKAAAKKVMSFNRVSTAPFVVARQGDAFSAKRPRLPVVVKPCRSGSAIGVSVVRKKKELAPAIKEAHRHGPEILIESYIKGRELTVAILDGQALPIVEIRPRSGFYDYNAKYTKGLTDFIAPAALQKTEAAGVVKHALAAYNALGCSGGARVDVMLSEAARPYVLEVNTIPGLTEMSLFPRAASAVGIDYPSLVERMLLSAFVDRG
ncbi:MAG: D-alanine--D-alanine ligase [Deltaproteobacteria bacterium]|nr:D-alanine--D-alanine ligase [Deltaproteobacteria bacterium]